MAMTSDELFTEAAARGLQLGHMCQYSYVSGSVSKNDHWEAVFNNGKGVLTKGSGRSPAAALRSALYGADASPAKVVVKHLKRPITDDDLACLD